jgi:hypothetical protein
LKHGYFENKEEKIAAFRVSVIAESFGSGARQLLQVRSTTLAQTLLAIISVNHTRV